MDVKSARDTEGCPVNIYIKINSNGRGKYEYYDTGCAIEYDSNHVVTHKWSKVVKTGSLKLNEAELELLWDVVNQTNFFNLTEDYRMAMGLSYAFIMVQADGGRHIVDNIGMEVPEIRRLVQATNAIMPEGVTLEYGERLLP